MQESNTLRRSDLGLLAVLVAIAEAHSVSGAARRLGMTQPSVSHALRRLRDLVKDPLFERSGNRLVMTPLAEAMLPTAREVVEKGTALLAPNDFDPTRDSFRWRIGVSDYALTAFGDTLIAHVRAINPQLRIDFLPVTATTLDDLLVQRLDFAFWGDLSDPRLVPPILVTQLFQESYIGVMCADHPLARQARTGGLTLEAWLSFPHVLFTSQTPSMSSIDRVLAGLGHRRHIALVSPSHGMNLRSLSATTHLLALPARLGHLVTSDAHVVFPLPLDVPAYPYFLLGHARLHTSAALQFMHDLIRDLCRSSSPTAETGEADPSPNRHRHPRHRSTH